MWKLPCMVWMVQRQFSMCKSNALLVMPYLLWVQLSLGAGKKINVLCVDDLKDNVLFVNAKKGFTLPYLHYHLELLFRGHLSSHANWPCIQDRLHQWWCAHARPLQGIALQMASSTTLSCKSSNHWIAFAHRQLKTNFQTNMWSFMRLYVSLPHFPSIQSIQGHHIGWRWMPASEGQMWTCTRQTCRQKSQIPHHCWQEIQRLVYGLWSQIRQNPWSLQVMHEPENNQHVIQMLQVHGLVVSTSRLFCVWSCVLLATICIEGSRPGRIQHYVVDKFHAHGHSAKCLCNPRVLSTYLCFPCLHCFTQ